jgi:hypothetical protein
MLSPALKTPTEFKQAHELEAAKQQAAERGARLHLIREYFGTFHPEAWGWFVKLIPEVQDWFNKDGTPK